MDKKEAIWIAISALQYVIHVCENDPSIFQGDGGEHIAEKKEALALLQKEVQ